MIISGIYKIKNKINNKFYIGSSKDLEKRKKEHWRMMLKNKHHSNYLQNAVNKYGIENFEFSILEFCNIENIIIREQFYIDSLKPEYNINICAYSRVGTKLSKEHVQKLKDRVFTQEWKDNISKGNLGKKRSKIFSEGVKTRMEKIVYQYDKFENFIKEWPSINKASKVLKINASCISAVACNYKYRQRAGGFIWKFIKN